MRITQELTKTCHRILWLEQPSCKDFMTVGLYEAPGFTGTNYKAACVIPECVLIRLVFKARNSAKI